MSNKKGEEMLFSRINLMPQDLGSLYKNKKKMITAFKVKVIVRSYESLNMSSEITS